MFILADLLNIFINLSFAVQIIVTLLLLLVVLMQRPKQEGLGAAFGSAMTDQAFGARTTDILQKATVYLGTIFMLLAFLMGIMLNRQFKEQASSLATAVEEAPVVVPTTPATPQELLEKLKPAVPATPLTPVTPAETIPVTPLTPAVPASTPEAPAPTPAS